MDTDLDGNDEQGTSPLLGAAGLQEDPSSTLPLTLVRLLQAVPFDLVQHAPGTHTERHEVVSSGHGRA